MRLESGHLCPERRGTKLYMPRETGHKVVHEPRDKALSDLVPSFSIQKSTQLCSNAGLEPDPILA